MMRLFGELGTAQHQIIEAPAFALHHRSPTTDNTILLTLTTDQTNQYHENYERERGQSKHYVLVAYQNNVRLMG